MLRDDVNWIAAVAFYLLFLVGLVVFVILLGLEKGSVAWTLGYGALFGLVTYATYDLTNLATTKGWPLAVTLVDLAWGAVLAASVATLTHLVVTKFFA